MVGYSVTSEILQYLENGVSYRVLTVMASESVRCAIHTPYLSPLRHLDRFKLLRPETKSTTCLPLGVATAPRSMGSADPAAFTTADLAGRVEYDEWSMA